ncbi:MAG: hypothetical protein U9N44_07780 [Chloroflexota bacterium]|nr:hypothetical protein [Chloroflexota bacterium]
MIWFRRVMTLPLILIFIVLIVAAVAVTSVNNTAGNPEFYNGQMVEADMYNYIYDAVLPTALDEIDTGETSDAPIDIANFEDEILAAAEQVLPAWWLQAQFEAATRIVVPYFVDDTAGFSYTLVVKDRVEDAGEAIKDQILDSAAFADLYDDLMAYIAEQLYQNLSDLPPDVDITQQDVEDELRDAVTLPWLVTQLEIAIDEIIPYLTGDQNHFIINVPLQDVVTDELLLAMLGPGNEEYLSDAREWIGEGWSFTDVDVRNELGDDAEQQLDDARSYIRDGYTVTQDGLRDAMFDNPQDAETFDDARHWIDVGRTWLWALWVTPLLILIGIGFLGGRGWKTRLAGPLVILFLISLAIFLGAMVGWSQYGEDKLGNVMPDTWEHEGVQAVMIEKGSELAVNVGAGVADEIGNEAMYMMIASGVGLVGVCVWWIVDSRRKPDVKPGRYR